MERIKSSVKNYTSRWISLLLLFLITLAIWLAWFLFDLIREAIYTIYCHLFLGGECGIQSLRPFHSLHTALPYVGLIGGAVILLSIGISVFKKEWLEHALIFGSTAIFYALGAFLSIRKQSFAPHYVYLADAFNHGNIILKDFIPVWGEHDLTFYNGEWSVSFPPAPAMLMMPFVAIFGKSFNDVIFTLIIGALNAALFYELVSRIDKELEGVINLRKSTQIALTIAFAFGTSHWWVASFGQVWFTAHIVATMFLLLALIETFGKRRLLCVSLWLGFAFLARPPILLSVPIFIWLLYPKYNFTKLIMGLIPLGVVCIGVGVYNYLRYDSPFESGYQYVLADPLLSSRVKSNGLFNIIYLQENLINSLLKLPELSKTFPFVVMDGWGLSLLVSTPLLILLIIAPWNLKVVRAMVLGALLVAIPTLLYHNTGWLQSSYRFSLDYLPFLFVPIIVSTRGRLTWMSVILVILSVVMGIFSLLNFYSLLYGGI